MEQQQPSKGAATSVPLATGSKRPVLITILAVLSFIGYPLVFINVLNPLASALFVPLYGSFYLPIMAVMSALGFIGFIGLWQMKKWGLYLYAASIVFSILANALLGEFSWANPILPIVFVILVGLYYKRMK
ncbi:hypothetical protein HY623_00305 [Candidatus Uhrbacteria bacterium]|nr:hypothetical protein [Candidatus Uhrbacteria bacterium]